MSPYLYVNLKRLNQFDVLIYCHLVKLEVNISLIGRLSLVKAWLKSSTISSKAHGSVPQAIFICTIDKFGAIKVSGHNVHMALDVFFINHQ